MEYTVNGKVYTDHPLMDEIVYNCKEILKGIVIKNNVLAESFDDEYTYYQAETYLMIKDGIITFNVFPFTAEMLLAYGIPPEDVDAILVNRENIPSYQRDNIMEFCCNYFLENYVETNKYYRTFLGLPEYGTNEYNIYINKSYFPSDYKTEDIDFTKPIHEFNNKDLAILYATGKIDQLLSTYSGSNYQYLRFLGDKKLDNYMIRKANKWDILYIPHVEELVESKFIEFYNLNRNMYLSKTYSDAFAYSSDYYEQMMIILLISQTFNDMIVDVPEWYIRRDIFDIRSVQYFLESYGVAFFKGIPLKYQIRIVKNLNKLIKYKSTNKNNMDILDIFALNNTSIYKYYLFKKRKTTADGKYVEGLFDYEKYDLEFIQTKIGDTYDNYIKDQIYRTRYDDITYSDKYWDGEEDHNYVKEQHVSRDFTIEGTKYMSLEYKNSIMDYMFQMQYFVGMLTDGFIDTDDLSIPVPSLQSGVNFKLSNLFLMLFILTYEYDEASLDILYPEELREKGTDKKPLPENKDSYDHKYYDSQETPDYHDIKWCDKEFDEFIPSEDCYDWNKRQYPEFYESESYNHNNRVYGFNFKLDINSIKNTLYKRHSKNQFDGGFTLSDFFVDEFIVPTKISTIEELVEIYNTNKNCYDKLKEKMVNGIDNHDDYMIHQYVFNQFFTKEFDKESYGVYQKNDELLLFNSLDEVLRERDYILYNIFTKIISEQNIEVRRDNIRNIMNDIVNTLEYYLSYEGLEYIFSFTTVASFNSLINYLYLMLNFFKSYKVYFLDPFTTYVVDDNLNGSARAYDVIAEKKITYWKEDKQFAADVVSKNVEKILKDEKPFHETIVEILDIYGHFDPDPNDDYDYDGMYADAADEGYKEADGAYAVGYRRDKNGNLINEAYPYIVLNGGLAQGSRRDLWDLNGGSAIEMKDYFDINAGYAFDVEDNKTDYWRTAFNYIVDGGSASTNQFITRTMHVKVIDRQIQAEIILAKDKANRLIQKEDGLYLQDIWQEKGDFDEIVTDVNSLFEQYNNIYNETLKDIIIVTDEESLDNKIEKHINLYLDGMKKVVDYMNQDSFENKLYNYTDSKVEELYDTVDGFVPFGWETF